MAFTIDANFEPVDPAESAVAWQLDPLDDQTGDYLVVDHVDMVRIAYVAAEAAARFQRDGLGQDPMDWMLSPSDLFNGHPPIAACRRKNACSLAILVHGLGLPEDISPTQLNAVFAENGLLEVDSDAGWQI